MHRYLRSIILLSVTIALFSACSREPDHMRYVPKDAVVVAGINMKSLSKKIAWNVITGSKLFQEMQKRIPEKNAVSGLENAGIDVSNSFYVYVKTDNRYKGGNRITGLVPLSDAGAWEAYVKQAFPNVEIKQQGDRKEASLGRDMYVGWNKKLLIVINVMSVSADNAGETEGNNSGPKVNVSSAMDKTDASAEMDSAFSVRTENSILGNNRFTGLEKEDHDVIFWLNYDQLMTQYMSSNMGEKMGVSLSNTLWKDAAFTAGFDFKKGKITGDMRYYMPDAMKEIGDSLGSTNADKEMIERLPLQNMDMLFAMHLSPKGVKAMLEKAGFLGLANVGLSTQGMSVDNVLDAFTGDMAILMSDFSLKTESVTDSFMGQAVVHQNQKPSLSMSYVMKINKKDDFQKIVQLAKNVGLVPMKDGYFLPLDEKDSVYMLMNDQYVVLSNKYPNASGFLQGEYKAQKMPEALTPAVLGNPMAFYFDVQQFLKNIDPAISHSAHDSAMIVESKMLLNNISITGGAFKNNAFESHLDINFINTEENSIIELMDFGMRMSDADKISSK
jgi:hypothetical protein